MLMHVRNALQLNEVRNWRWDKNFPTSHDHLMPPHPHKIVGLGSSTEPSCRRRSPSWGSWATLLPPSSYRVKRWGMRSTFSSWASRASTQRTCSVPSSRASGRSVVCDVFWGRETALLIHFTFPIGNFKVSVIVAYARNCNSSLSLYRFSQEGLQHGLAIAYHPLPAPPLPVQPGGGLRIHLHDGGHSLGTLRRRPLSSWLQSGEPKSRSQS